MLPTGTKVAQPREAGLFQLLVHIEVIFLDLLVIDVEKSCSTSGASSRVVKVKVGILQIGQQVSQERFIPGAG
jgi:hypothetical protein